MSGARPTVETARYFFRGEYQDSITRRSADALLDWAEANLPQSVPSKINPALTNAQAIKIMRDGISNHAPEDALRPLMAKNVRRVCR